MSIVGYSKYALKRSKDALITASLPYYQFRNSRPIWEFLNREGIKLYRKEAIELTAAQKRLIDDLKKNGIAVSHLDELFPGANLLPVLCQNAESLRGQADVRNKKVFLSYLWDICPTIDDKDPFIKLTFSKNVLSIVNGYLDACAKSRLFTLNITKPVGEAAAAKGSQRWHRDPDDKKMCKMFIYLTDVDAASGPFTYVPGSQSGGHWYTLFPQKPPRGVNLPEGVLEKVVPAADIKPMTASAGTVIFADTSGLHRGGYATGKERIMYTAAFTSNASLWPKEYTLTHDFEARLAHAHPWVRYALAD